MKPEIKKQIILHLPYLAFVYLFGKVGQAFRLAQGADLLLADGLFPKAAWGEQKPHLSAAQCGELARDAGAKALVVTHLNPEHDPETLLREARECYPGADLARTGLSLEI